MKQRDHRMSADQLRAYTEASAACDEWGAMWCSLVRDCINGGFTPQEIADHTGEDVRDVLAALNLPVSLAELDPDAMDQAAREAASGPSHRWPCGCLKNGAPHRLGCPGVPEHIDTTQTPVIRLLGDSSKEA